MTMPAPVLVQLTPRPAETDKVVVVEDLDMLVESSMCSCSAGDDNPY